MSAKHKAIITGDIINSSLLPKRIRGKLYPHLDAFIKSLGKDITGEVNHGDWFRVILNNPAVALRTALNIKCYMKGMTAQHLSPSVKRNSDASFKIDARIAIGIGKVDFINSRLGTSDGEAFQLSGRTLDRIKSSHHTLAAASSNAAINDELNVLLILLDAVFLKITPQQCQVIRRKLNGMKETDIAAELKIIQSAVNQRSTAGSWHAIEAAVNRFETIIKNV
jgi:hypothetical protein